MDETDPTPPGDGRHDGRHDGRDDAGQTSLPLFRDEPIAYELTARARRVVAPETLPDLSVVPRPTGSSQPDGGADEPDPFDTRPVRARALRRSGRTLEDVADILGVELALARRWCGEVRPPRRRRRPGTVVLSAVLSDDAALGSAADAAYARFLEAYGSGDAVWTARAALVVGTSVTTTGYAAVLDLRDVDVAAAALAFLRDETPLDTSRVRVTLRVGAEVPVDVASHGWATALDLPHARVTGHRSDGPREDVEASVRISVPEVAAAIEGWRRALVGDLGNGHPSR